MKNDLRELETKYFAAAKEARLAKIAVKAAQDAKPFDKLDFMTALRRLSDAGKARADAFALVLAAGGGA